MPLKLATFRPQQLALAIGSAILLATGTLLGSNEAIAQVITDAERNAEALQPELPSALMAPQQTRKPVTNLRRDKALEPLQPVLPASMQRESEPAQNARVDAEPAQDQPAPAIDDGVEEIPTLYEYEDEVEVEVEDDVPTVDVLEDSEVIETEPTESEIAPEDYVVDFDTTTDTIAPVEPEPATPVVVTEPEEPTAPDVDVATDKRMDAPEPQIPASMSAPVSAPPTSLTPSRADAAAQLAREQQALATTRPAPPEPIASATQATGLRVYYASGNARLSPREHRSVEAFCAQATATPGSLVEVHVSMPSAQSVRLVALRQDELRSVFQANGINGERLRFRLAPYDASTPGYPGEPLAPHYAEFRLIENP